MIMCLIYGYYFYTTTEEMFSSVATVSATLVAVGCDYYLTSDAVMYHLSTSGVLMDIDT